MDYLIGGIAGVGAGFFSNPFDVVKTRMQLQGELKARGQHAIHYKNVFHAMYAIVRADGFNALQSGIGPALWFQLLVNGTRLGIYQTADNYGLVRNERGETDLVKGILIGTISGAAGATIGSPLLLVKTQLMSHSHVSIAVGYQHNHNNTLKAFKWIYDKYGIRGLWRGSVSAIIRNAIGSPAQIVTFSRIKETMKKEGYFTESPYIATFIASFLGGFIKAVIMTPFDVITTRLYNQGVDAHGKGLYYEGLVDCAWKINKSEGLSAFYKGFSPSFLRQAPHSVLLLVFWDLLKDLHEYTIKKYGGN